MKKEDLGKLIVESAKGLVKVVYMKIGKAFTVCF